MSDKDEKKSDAPAAKAPQAQAAAGPTYKYELGDLLKIPCHSGHYVAVVVKRYPDYDAAVEGYERSFATILQSPHGKADHDQPYYFCQVNNPERKHVGVAEEHATLKRAANAPKKVAAAAKA